MYDCCFFLCEQGRKLSISGLCGILSLLRTTVSAPRSTLRFVLYDRLPQRGQRAARRSLSAFPVYLRFPLLLRIMQQYHSRHVESSQTGVHPALEATVRKHLVHPFRKPVLDHNRRAFEAVADRVARLAAPVVLDTGCGTGESTAVLARRYTHAVVIGVDKSAHRLSKFAAHDTPPDNAIHVRADLVDFWRLAADAGWRVEKQYILYPNPWPRPEHLMRRWHGHPVFACILALGGHCELRSNWRVYVEEFAEACRIAANSTATVEPFVPQDYTTPFERKYALSGQQLYRYCARLHAQPLAQ